MNITPLDEQALLALYNGKYLKISYYIGKQGRQHIQLRGNGRRVSMSYARALLQVKLGRILEKGIEADHIDDNRMNDNVDNLQPLTSEENRKKSQKGMTYVDVVCSSCSLKYKMPLYRYNQNIKAKRGFSCSLKCNAKLTQLKRKQNKELKNA